MTRFENTSVVLDKCEHMAVWIFIKVTIAINIEENLDLMLNISPDISLAKHCVEHAEVSSVRRETGCVRDMLDMVVEIGVQVCVVT